MFERDVILSFLLVLWIICTDRLQISTVKLILFEFIRRIRLKIGFLTTFAQKRRRRIKKYDFREIDKNRNEIFHFESRTPTDVKHLLANRKTVRFKNVLKKKKKTSDFRIEFRSAAARKIRICRVGTTAVI